MTTSTHRRSSPFNITVKVTKEIHQTLYTLARRYKPEGKLMPLGEVVDHLAHLQMQHAGSYVPSQYAKTEVEQQILEQLAATLEKTDPVTRFWYERILQLEGKQIQALRKLVRHSRKTKRQLAADVLSIPAFQSLFWAQQYAREMQGKLALLFKKKGAAARKRGPFYVKGDLQQPASLEVTLRTPAVKP